MFDTSKAFSGFAVDDIDAARAFYGDVLGIELVERGSPAMMFGLQLSVDNVVLVYARAGHQPAPYTILNFPVDDIDATVDALAAAGVDLERYEGVPQDDRGVMRGKSVDRGPDIGWFTDPAGNVLSVIED